MQRAESFCPGCKVAGDGAAEQHPAQRPCPPCCLGQSSGVRIQQGGIEVLCHVDIAELQRILLARGRGGCWHVPVQAPLVPAPPDRVRLENHLRRGAMHRRQCHASMLAAKVRARGKFKARAAKEALALTSGTRSSQLADPDC